VRGKKQTEYSVLRRWQNGQTRTKNNRHHCKRLHLPQKNSDHCHDSDALRSSLTGTQLQDLPKNQIQLIRPCHSASQITGFCSLLARMQHRFKPVICNGGQGQQKEKWQQLRNKASKQVHVRRPSTAGKVFCLSARRTGGDSNTEGGNAEAIGRYQKFQRAGDHPAFIPFKAVGLEEHRPALQCDSLGRNAQFVRPNKHAGPVFLSVVLGSQEVIATSTPLICSTRYCVKGITVDIRTLHQSSTTYQVTANGSFACNISFSWSSALLYTRSLFVQRRLHRVLEKVRLETCCYGEIQTWLPNRLTRTLLT